MGVVHREIERCERELPPIKNAGGGFLRVVHFLNNLARNFLRRIAIIGGESIEHLFVPNPVLEHLRWSFDKIAGHAGAGEASVLRARCYFMETMPELMKQRLDIGVRHE